MAKLTMKDVALKAGVSRQAVSKILNNTDTWISSETRQRVLEVVKELNYQPDYLAQSLRSGKRLSLAVAGTGTLGQMDDLTISQFYAGIGETAGRRGYCMLFVPMENDLESQLIKIAKSRMADGLVIFTYPRTLDAFIEKTMPVLQEERFPFVALHSDTRPLDCNHVGFNAEGAGYLAARHLIEQGYQAIAPVCSRNRGFDEEYLRGYGRALAGAGLPAVDLGIDEHTPLLTARDGYNLGQNLAGRGQGLPQAYIVSSDRVAHGLTRFLAEQGKNIGADTGVVGCGNSFGDEQAALPFLTSVDSMVKARGSKAAEILFNALGQSPAAAVNEHFIFEPELVVRESSRKKN